MAFNTQAAVRKSVPVGRPVQISKDTLMPLGMVGGLILGIIGCYSWLDSRFDGLVQNNNNRFSEIATALHTLEERLRDLELKQHHRWDSLDMKEWTLDFKRLNPDLNVPPIAAAEAYGK